jgi:hypothetical protein
MADMLSLRPQLTFSRNGDIYKLDLTVAFPEAKFLKARNAEYDGPHLIGKCNDRHWVNFYISEMETGGTHEVSDDYIFVDRQLPSRKPLIEVTVHITLRDETEYVAHVLLHQNDAPRGETLQLHVHQQ